MAEDQVHKLHVSWSTFRRTVNDRIPDYTSRVRAVRNRLAGSQPPPGPGK